VPRGQRREHGADIYDDLRHQFRALPLRRRCGLMGAWPPLTRWAASLAVMPAKEDAREAVRRALKDHSTDTLVIRPRRCSSQNEGQW